MWLSGPFERKPADLRVAIYSLGVGIIPDSGTDLKVNYVSSVMFDLLTGTWTKLLEEYTPNDYRVLDEKSNSTDFLDGKKVSFGLESKKGHINFSFDLGIANYPKQYFVISRIFQIFLPNCAITDYSNPGYVPPTQYNMSLIPNPVRLMPGEEKTSE